MKTVLSIVTVSACVLLVSAYGRQGSMKWGAYPSLPLPEPRPVPPPPIAPVPLFQEIRPVFPMIQLPPPQTLPLFQEFGFQSDFGDGGLAQGLAMPIPIMPFGGFGAGFGAGFRPGYMFDPDCDFGMLGPGLPYFDDQFHQRIADPNVGGIIRRQEFVPTFQNRLPVKPKARNLGLALKSN